MTLASIPNLERTTAASDANRRIDAIFSAKKEIEASVTVIGVIDRYQSVTVIVIMFALNAQEIEKVVFRLSQQSDKLGYGSMLEY